MRGNQQPVPPYGGGTEIEDGGMSNANFVDMRGNQQPVPPCEVESAIEDGELSNASVVNE